MDEGAELRDALKLLQDAREAGDAQRAETSLVSALLRISGVGIQTNQDTVAAGVRLLRPRDDSGTTRLEVHDQAMTRRRWFEVDGNGGVIWGDR
jgi:hypothetical protein